MHEWACDYLACEVGFRPPGQDQILYSVYGAGKYTEEESVTVRGNRVWCLSSCCSTTSTHIKTGWFRMILWMRSQIEVLFAGPHSSDGSENVMLKPVVSDCLTVIAWVCFSNDQKCVFTATPGLIKQEVLLFLHDNNQSCRSA